MLRVLLVDDLAADREVLTAAFRRRGARVVEAADDAEAYEAIDDHACKFDLLVTDINLGRGTTGFDVARAARQKQPELAVVYITAHDIRTSVHAVPHSRAYRKPIRLADLADRALDYVADRARAYRPDDGDDASLKA